MTVTRKTKPKKKPKPKTIVRLELPARHLKPVLTSALAEAEPARVDLVVVDGGVKIAEVPLPRRIWRVLVDYCTRA